MIEKRTDSKGKISYRVKIRLKGYPSVSETFERLTDARRWEGQTVAEIRDNRYFKQLESKKHTLAELIDRYMDVELSQRNSDKEKFKMQLLWWKNKIGAYLLLDITPSLLSECKDTLGKEPSPKPKNGKLTRSNATVNRYMACLSTVLTKAVKEWGWMEENPMFKVTKKKEPKGRIRFLSENERKSLLIECQKISHELYLLVLIALSVGARYGEIVNLKWQNIDFNNKMFHFMDTKNGEDRGVPIPSLVLSELIEFSKVRNIKSDFVFISSDGQKLIYFRDRFTDAVNNAKIKDFRFHDLRHTAASYLAMNNASLLDIAEILGHKTLSMVKRYSHLTKKHTAELLERMNDQQFMNIK